MSNTWLILIAGLAQTVILGTMGFTRTVHPEFTQKHKWKIFSAYIVIALLVTAASTFLSYEKDIKNQAAVDNMLKQITTLQKQTKRSPRFEFAGIKTSTADDGSILATPQFLNTSDVDAISYRMANSIARRTTLPTQGDISAMDKELSKYQMGPMPNGTGISRGMGLAAPPMKISKDTVENDGGNGPFYLLAIAEYSEKQPDNGDYWRTEVCAK